MARHHDGGLPQLSVGEETRNATLSYQDNFVGTELNHGAGYAAIAKAYQSRHTRCVAGCFGGRCRGMDAAA